jgi:hypothetical protein
MNANRSRARRAASLALAVAVAGSGALVHVGRRRLLRWGATDAEIAAVQPGDDLIPDANVTATRGITIRRSRESVWPWIAQIGQGRGGFYSYDQLENLFGLDIHSADRVIPALQQLEAGDEVRLAPNVGLVAAAVEPGHALVLRGALPLAQAPPFDSTWAFILCEQPDGTTRLLSRERYGYKRWWAPLVVEPTQAASFVMSRKMLLGIRDRAERAALVHADRAAARKGLDDVRAR